MTPTPAATMDDDLLPCPFCGGEAELCTGLHEWWIKCCMCFASTKMAGTSSLAMNYWDTRAALQVDNPSEPQPLMTFRKDGHEAYFDIEDGELVYGGDLPIHESARMLFEQLKKYAPQMAEWKVAASRGQAAPQVDMLVEALRELTDMYAYTWDQVDGCLVMMGSGVEKFEKAHQKASEALAQYAKAKE